MSLLFLAADAVAYAGPSAIGLVKGSTNASIGEEALLPDTALFSGDRLNVDDGVALVALASTSRMILYHHTKASFLRDSDGVTVLLSQGTVSLFHGENTEPVRVEVGEISVAPVPGFETVGDVAEGSGVVVVTAKNGRLRVEGNGRVIILASGETLRLALRAGSPQSATEASVAKVPLPSLRSTPQSPAVYTPEASPGGGSLRVSGSELSPEEAAKAEPSWAAVDALGPPPSAPVTTTATGDTIGRALKPLADRRHPPSPHRPHH
jgi:hypothetical protein